LNAGKKASIKFRNLINFMFQACGTMFKLLQGYSAETSGGLLICLPREKAAAFCKVR